MRFGFRPAGGAIAVALGVISLVAGTSIMSQAQAGQKAAAGETAGKRFKNIRVLKNLPADQLMPTMQRFSQSLGVRCDACHVMTADRQGFARDDKEMKRTARKMILLVNNLNKKGSAIEGKATCFMCHHGQQEPQTVASGMTIGSPPRERERGDND
ncbi:MAG TPA: c-type cytochrome [Armatimonadota bacterium]|jgi:hypothetical protein